MGTNLEVLVNQINLELRFNPKANQLRYSVPNQGSSITYLRELCFRTLKEQVQLANQKRYWVRLDYELRIITQMGFADYFLIV